MGFRLLPVLLLLSSLLCCNKQITSYKNIAIHDNAGDNKEIILENDFLRFRFLPAKTEFILLDKSSGAEWRSNPENAASDPLADFITTQFMESQFSLQYADVAGVGMTLYSGEHSVGRNAFEYSLDGNSLEVNYTVGDLARTYLLPPAAPEERMLSFMNNMGRDDRRKIEASYRLYDINNLRGNDNRGELLALYPDLVREKVYVMRDSTQEYMKAQIEEFFIQAGYTYDDYREDSGRYASTGGVEKPAFNITLRYALDRDSLVLTVPFDKIAYRPSYPIVQLNLLPFMGAGSTGDDGYILVPDGSGALINFNNGRHNQIAYSNAVYGWDEAMPREAIVSDNKAPYPVFGIQKNSSAIVCIIEEGASYAAIRADVSGRNCSWNSVYPRFELIHGAVMDISGRSDRAVYLYEKKLPAGEAITLRITPCAEPGYVGMAKEYRRWLLEKYPDTGSKYTDNSPKQNGIPIAVEIVGAVNKTRHRLGIPFDLPLKLTSYKEAGEMIRDFASLGWEDVNVKFTGWFNHSVDHSVPSRVKLIRELGSKRHFKNIVSTSEQNGFSFYPEVDFLYMKDIKLFDGYNIYRDTARYVNRKRVEKYPYSIVWFGERSLWGKLSHVARPASMMAVMDRFTQKAESLGLRNIAFRSMGSRLSGDYNEKKHVSREAALRMRQEKLAGLSQSGARLLVDTGFAYSVPWASFICGMAIDDQGFGITDVSVPFYQIALHGLVPYTGRAINLSEDYTRNLLKTIECGAGLYFSFMTEESAVLQETKFRQFYANEYGKWINDANALYRKFSADFEGLYKQAIVDHAILAPGVTVTQYGDNSRVIVNLSANDWDYRDVNNSLVTIKANDYAVLRQGN